MTVYVDETRIYPVPKYGLKVTRWCHMMTDQVELDELHEMAQKIGLKREWFQDHPLHPHYDVYGFRQIVAIISGCVPLDTREMVKRCSFDRKREKQNE